MVAMVVSRNKLNELSYILGIALWMAAIIYFFAANWPGFGRGVKISLSVGLMVLCYGLSIGLARVLTRHSLVSSLLLLAGCLSFGVGVGLLGQIYNSHADSYLLFAIWFVPAFLLSLLTRLQSLYVLSYLLFHLSMWFYLFPSSLFIHYSEGRLALYLLAFAALNGILLLLVWRGYIVSKSLTYLSLSVLHTLFICLSNTFLFETYGFVLNLVYIPILIGQITYFLRRGERGYLFLLGIIAFLYALLKYVELSSRYYSEGFFLLAMIIVVAIIVGNVYLLKWLANRVKMGREQEDSWWGKLLLGVTTPLAAMVATFSLIAFVNIVFEHFPSYVYLFLALIGLIISMMFKSMDRSVRYTLLFIGYLLGMISTWEIDLFSIMIAFVLLIGISWFMMPSRYVRTIAYLAVNIQLMFSLFSIFLESESVLLILFLLNTFVCGVSLVRKERGWSEILYRNSLVYVLLYLFVLTFMGSEGSMFYFLYNVIFFVLVTGLLFWAVKEEKQYETRLSFLFWFAFLVYKYYDLLWKLVHKSIALAILGSLFLGVAIWLDRRDTARTANVPSNPIWRKTALIGLVILLQFAILGMQIGKSEYMLATGETIKLELVPVDPRSLIQGDYVRLRYAISSVEIDRDFHPWETVQLLLKPNEDGVYEYAGIYHYKGELNEEYIPSATDVFINAKSDGGQGFIYGIESYFVPEGTGRQVEREANFAYVQVGSNGDAILLRLSAE